MAFTTLLLFWAIIGPVLPKNLNSWKQLHHSPRELGSLFFDLEEASSEVQDNKNQICQTDNCKIISVELISGMNKSVNPCDNFYDFVCGSYQTEDRIPPYEASWGRFDMFQETVYRRIKGILEQEPTPEDILPVRQAKKWYRSCMDTEGMENRGLRPLESILMQVGGWPMTLDREEWNEDDHSWQSIEHEYFHLTGSYVFYKIQHLRSDYFDMDAVLITEPDLPLENEIPEEFRDYRKDDYDAYVMFIESVVQLFVDYNKADVSKSTIEKDARDLVEFEKNLYMLFREPSNDVEMTVADFIEWYEQNVTSLESDHEIQKIDFRDLLSRMFHMINDKVNESSSVQTERLGAYVELTKLLNETPKRTIVNYIHWYFVSSMLAYTTDEMRDVFFMLMQNEFDVQERAPRWLECTREMKMDRAAAYAFVQNYFSNETEKEVREMIENIRVEMAAEIEKSAWMDHETKRLSTDKLNSIEVFIGFPSWYRNRTAVINAYKGLTIGFDHFENVLSYRKYEIKQKMRSANNDDDDMGAMIDPLVVNAGYGPMVNAIELPAADFQAPLFTSQLPNNINYGIAGVVIGHEIGHGFDDSGIQLGKDGDETKISKAMLELYDKRAECFLNQFNKYYGVTDSDRTTPAYGDDSLGMRTRGENIADTTGLHSVFEAYRKILVAKPEGESKLLGFEEYTNNQMFFISFAATWCEAVTPKMLEKQLANDEHSPSRLRVIGAVSNTNDFANAFNCPKGSAMNPEDKCNIWKSPKAKAVTPKKLAHRRRYGHKKWTKN